MVRGRNWILTGLKQVIWMLATLLLGIIGLSACGSNTEPSSQGLNGAAGSGTSLNGRQIYLVNCASCHGPEAAGHADWHIKNPDGTLPPPPLNGDGHTWHHADGLLYRIVQDGGATLEGPDLPGFKSAMPAFGDQLDHQEIIAVVTYVKGLWGDKQSQGIVKRESQAHASEADPFPDPPDK